MVKDNIDYKGLIIGVLFLLLILYHVFFHGLMSGERAWCREHNYDGSSWFEDTCYKTHNGCTVNPAGVKRCESYRTYEDMIWIEYDSESK